ncbi:unnamed protein product [Albugo candida]|uniref:Uncharacterized protein n=1 Tax=Albugo candida TaxID=65357 RepID=A0A024G8F1_9STRA|nr:unnamed protein product [Albugo candida]|eukprot:CCI42607.1 unnamed protein product [Albugo candida]
MNSSNRRVVRSSVTRSDWCEEVFVKWGTSKQSAKEKDTLKSFARLRKSQREFSAFTIALLLFLSTARTFTRSYQRILTTRTGRSRRILQELELEPPKHERNHCRICQVHFRFSTRKMRSATYIFDSKIVPYLVWNTSV